jgi:hypothetical protein
VRDTRICGHTYISKVSGDLLICTHPKDHATTEMTDHSWEWLRRAEQPPPAPEPIDSPPEIEDLIEGIVIGLYDPYIESLLAALHGRKRAMRSVPHPYGRVEE